MKAAEHGLRDVLVVHDRPDVDHRPHPFLPGSDHGLRRVLLPRLRWDARVAEADAHDAIRVPLVVALLSLRDTIDHHQLPSGIYNVPGCRVVDILPRDSHIHAVHPVDVRSCRRCGRGDSRRKTGWLQESGRRSPGFLTLESVDRTQAFYA
eukprot:scaffold2263_cov272-Pinguiococcus_pyrenoidosus.AAC.7